MSLFGPFTQGQFDAFEDYVVDFDPFAKRRLTPRQAKYCERWRKRVPMQTSDLRPAFHARVGQSGSRIYRRQAPLADMLRRFFPQ